MKNGNWKLNSFQWSVYMEFLELVMMDSKNIEVKCKLCPPTKMTCWSSVTSVSILRRSKLEYSRWLKTNVLTRVICWRHEHTTPNSAFLMSEHINNLQMLYTWLVRGLVVTTPKLWAESSDLTIESPCLKETVNFVKVAP